MSIERKVVKIKGVEFEIEQFGGREGTDLFKEVFKIVSPVLPILFEAYQDAGAAFSILGYAGEIFNQFDNKLIDALLARTTKGKYMIDFDKDFAGSIDLLILLLVDIIKFNWGKSLASLVEEFPNVLQG